MKSDNYFSATESSYFEPYRYNFHDYDTYMTLLEKNNTRITRTYMVQSGSQTIRGPLIHTLDFKKDATTAKTPLMRATHELYTYVKTTPLKQLREKNGIKQDWFAKQLGVNKVTLWRWEIKWPHR